jgi:predicted nucleotidyltransferase
VSTLEALGFGVCGLGVELFMVPGRIVRIGVPPVRIEVMNQIDGVAFEECWARRIEEVWDGVQVYLLSLEDLKVNKRASGRAKDLADLDELP